MSQFMLEWHGNRSRLGRSFLMYTEDMDAQRFTELAQWLGQPCTFHSAPNANEYDPKDAQPYFHHSKTVGPDPTPNLKPMPEPTPDPDRDPNPIPRWMWRARRPPRRSSRRRLSRP